MALKYVTVDVFTDVRFGGNQLAVVLDAGGLDTELMQAIASEFSYAETPFVRPPADPAHTAEMRIFTPKAEVPFAATPTSVLPLPWRASARFWASRLGTPCSSRNRPDWSRLRSTARAACRWGPGLRRRNPSSSAIRCAPMSSRPAADLRRPISRRRSMIRAGPRVACPWYSPVRRARRSWRGPDAGAFAAHLPASVAVGIELYAPAAGTAPNGADYTARVFASEFGVIEDAATGSRARCGREISRSVRSTTTSASDSPI